MKFSAVVLATALALTPQLADATRTSLISRAHKMAIKHSTGLARDLRLAFAGILVSDPQSSPSQKAYCVSSPSISNSSLTSGNTSSWAHPSSSVTHGKASPTSTKSSTATPSAPPSPWKPISTYSGSTFFNGWSFWNTADPTHGTVQFLSQTDAQNAGLAQINAAGNAVMRVDTTPTVATNRNSVRITTDLTFTEGLVVMDAVHMPTGCGTWPGECRVVPSYTLPIPTCSSILDSFLVQWPELARRRGNRYHRGRQ